MRTFMPTIFETTDAPNGLSTPYTLANGNNFHGQISGSSDIDWVRVEVEAGYGYIFQFAGDGFADSLGSTRITLRNEFGTQIQASNGGPGVLIGNTPTADGVVYVQMQGLAGAVGNYTLDVIQEIGSGLGTRQTLAVGATMNSAIETGFDTDWVRVTLEAGYGYVFEFLADGSASSMGTGLMTLYSGTGAQIASDSGGAGLFLEYTPTSGGTFYIEMQGFDGATGGYNLSLNATTIFGTDGPDLLPGTAFGDEIRGLAGNDTLLGLGGNDSLNGGDGADRLDGGTGGDTLNGGLGNDRYVIDDIGDFIVGEIRFSLGGGIDTVESWIDYRLPSNVEILRLMGTADLNGTGGFAPEAIVGQAGKNVLDGGGGNDVITAKAGDDTLIGGPGADSLVGDAGADVFDFNATSESRPGQASRDFINGFVHGEDLIDLSDIDADLFAFADQAFSFIGNAAFSGTAGELRFFTFGGGNFNIVEADVDGDGVADMQIFVNLTNFMTESDFIL